MGSASLDCSCNLIRTCIAWYLKYIVRGLSCHNIYRLCCGVIIDQIAIMNGDDWPTV